MLDKCSCNNIKSGCLLGRLVPALQQGFTGRIVHTEELVLFAALAVKCELVPLPEKVFLTFH